MRKNLLTTVFAAILLVFVGCSSDSSSSSCNLAALEAAFEKAAEKYKTSKDPEDCKAAAKIITDALNSKCIDKATADSYGAGLDCYTSGGGNNGGGDNTGGGDTDGGDNTGGGDCATLKADAINAVEDYVGGDIDCAEAAAIVNTAKDAGCLSATEIAQAEQYLPCF